MLTCENCFYWHEIQDVANDSGIVAKQRKGMCKVNPPNATLVPVQGALGQSGMAVLSFRPECSHDDTCGEWEPREQEEEQAH